MCSSCVSRREKEVKEPKKSVKGCYFFVTWVHPPSSGELILSLVTSLVGDAKNEGCFSGDVPRAIGYPSCYVFVV